MYIKCMTSILRMWHQYLYMCSYINAYGCYIHIFICPCINLYAVLLYICTWDGHIELLNSLHIFFTSLNFVIYVSNWFLVLKYLISYVIYMEIMLVRYVKYRKCSSVYLHEVTFRFPISYHAPATFSWP